MAIRITKCLQLTGHLTYCAQCHQAIKKNIDIIIIRYGTMGVARYHCECIQRILTPPVMADKKEVDLDEED